MSTLGKLAKLAKKHADVRVEKGPLGMYEAKVGNKVVGKAYPWEDSRGQYVMQNVRVSPNFRNRGVGRALYSEIERMTGRQLSPATSLSDDAFEFWKRYRPEAVAQDLRHRPELPGQRVMVRGKMGTISSASGRGATIDLDTVDGSRSTTTLRADEIDDAIKAASATNYAEGGSVKEPSVLGAATDPDFWLDAAGRLRDYIGRGAVAGWAGAPMDIASLLAAASDAENKMLYGDDAPALDLGEDPVGGSEWLGKKMQEYGIIGDERNLGGEIAAGVLGPGMLKALRSGAAAAGDAALPYLQRATESLGVPESAATVSNVVKPKGGQWLKGHVENRLDRLKPHARMDTEYSAQLRELEDMNPGNAQKFFGWLKARNIQSPDFQRVPRVDAYNTYAAETGAPPMTMPPDIASMNKWLDAQLNRYVKNEMATPEDPVRALAERGITHANLADDGPTVMLGKRRREAGFPAEGMGQSPTARAWEDASDQFLRSRSAGEFLGPSAFYDQPPIETDPWLAKVPPKTPVNYMLRSSGANQGVGFDHLVDELTNAMNPNSGLPPELLLKPESLSRVSVPQAVERVAKINEWRAAQKVQADLARANNAATQLVKEYPEKGMRWVQLTQPAEGSVTGEQVFGAPRTRGGANEADRILDGLFDNPGEESAFRDSAASRQALADALKYEGDTMGHCVGGYCDDVATGRSKIYSLRDAKGQPHVTIEVEPRTQAISGDELMRLDPNLDWERDIVANDGHHDLWNWTKQNRPDLWEKMNTPRIVQIKGKGNAKPKDDYLPFVQDFVKTQGQWSDVGDFANTGLLRLYPESPIAEWLKRQGREVPRHLTQKEMDDLSNEFNAHVSGYADGGSVRDPNAPDPFLPDAFNDPQFRADVRENFDNLTGALSDGEFWSELMQRALAPSKVYAGAQNEGYAAGGIVKAGKKALDLLKENPNFAKFFESSKVVDEAGEPLRVYHGTQGDFESFDPSIGNSEGDFGRGIYMSTSTDDVAENYAGMGPDATDKAERYVDRYGDGFYEDDAIEQARRELGMVNQGFTMPMYASLRNPVVLGKRGTIFDYNDNYDPELEDYVGEPTGKLVEFFDHLRDMADKYNINSDEIGQFHSRAMESALDYGGMRLSELDRLARDGDGIINATDDNGDLAVGEMMREALERMGYDGIIDETVPEKFKKMHGMMPGTKHIIAFKPGQVKSAIGNRGTFDPEDPRITYADGGSVESSVSDDDVMSIAEQVAAELKL